MSVSAIDSRVFRNLFGTQEIRDIFTDDAYVRRMIDTEAALARAQSKVGVIPADVGEKLTQALNAAVIEYEDLARSPALPLCRSPALAPLPSAGAGAPKSMGFPQTLTASP